MLARHRFAPSRGEPMTRRTNPPTCPAHSVPLVVFCPACRGRVGAGGDGRPHCDPRDLPMSLDTMPFGKHAGRPLSEIPSDYFRWLLDNAKENPSLRWPEATT